MAHRPPPACCNPDRSSQARTETRRFSRQISFMATKHTGSSMSALKVRTSRRSQLIDVTSQIEKLVDESGCQNGMCHLYVPHTTAAVLGNEGYDPDVARDMEIALDRLVPREGDYRHAE